MKKYFLSILSILLTLPVFSQDYNCFQTGRNYFVDSFDYLRAIRIDSIVSAGGNTIYYPFHTPRGNYFSNPNLDFTGGSWLGKRVIKTTDGTYYFDNIWNDTTVIKTQANVGDSWMFFNDTTSRYYMALLQSRDTMTVLGSLDSIKTILITAHDISGIVQSDPVDSFQIILSKNHGFVQIFDLYTFPYHPANAPYNNDIDYFLSKIVSLGGLSGPTRASLIFTLVNFQNPTIQQLYNWSAGDVYEYVYCGGEYPLPVCDPYGEIGYDSVTNVINNGSTTEYDFTGFINTLNGTPINPSGYTTHVIPFGSFNTSNTLLIDTLYMPEQYHTQSEYFFQYYSPNDTSFCYKSSRYSWYSSSLSGSTYNSFIEFADHYIYKMGLGLVEKFNSSADANFMVYDTALIYCKRNNDGCGNFINLGLQTNNFSQVFKIYPNPATDELYIEEPINDKFSYIMYNVLGQKVLNADNVYEKSIINVAALPTGMYYLTITDNTGRQTTSKISIRH
jgi:hypothetical protein